MTNRYVKIPIHQTTRTFMFDPKQYKPGSPDARQIILLSKSGSFDEQYLSFIELIEMISDNPHAMIRNAIKVSMSIDLLQKEVLYGNDFD